MTSPGVRIAGQMVAVSIAQGLPRGLGQTARRFQ